MRIQPKMDSFEKLQNIPLLPNEMWMAILSNIPIHHLIPLRSVSSQWKIAIESICAIKKSLVIVSEWNRDHISALVKRFNGQLELNRDFVFLRFANKTSLSGEFCSLCARLFPRIEQFFIVPHYEDAPVELIGLLKLWSGSLSTLSLNFTNLSVGLCEQINKLSTLKRLDLAIHSIGVSRRLIPAYSRLEHFSTRIPDDIIYLYVEPHFGEVFKSLCIAEHCVFYQEILMWPHEFDQIMANLTHLQLRANHPQVLTFICHNSVQLRMLKINMSYHILVPEIIRNISRLVHLTELEISCVKVDLKALNVQILPLENIRTLALVDFEFTENGAANLNCLQLARTIVALFPNVQKLTVKSSHYTYAWFFNTIKAYFVKHLTNLVWYDFGFEDSELKNDEKQIDGEYHRVIPEFKKVAQIV